MRIWNLHHQPLQPTTPLTTAAFESAVFGKPWFDRCDYHVFLDENGVPVGLCHLIRIPERTYLVALCFQSPELGQQSLETLGQLLSDSGDRPIRAGLTLSDNLGYVGIDTVAGAAGFSARDPAANEWLPRLGFAPVEKYRIYELPLTGFRPPLDRETLRLRRVARTVVDEHPSCEGERFNWAFGHLHEVAITVYLATGDAIGHAEFAFPNSEICGPLPQTAILTRLEASDDRGHSRWTMIAAAETLGQMGVPTMRIVQRQDAEPAAWIRRLAFQEVDASVVLERRA